MLNDFKLLTATVRLVLCFQMTSEFEYNLLAIVQINAAAHPSSKAVRNLSHYQISDEEWVSDKVTLYLDLLNRAPLTTVPSDTITAQSVIETRSSTENLATRQTLRGAD